MRLNRLLVVVYMFAALFIVAGIVSLASHKDVSIVVPDTYSKDYVEDAESYEVQFLDSYEWDDIKPESNDTSYVFTTVDIASESFATTSVTAADYKVQYQTSMDIAISTLGESDAWILCSNGVFDAYPAVSYSSIADKLSYIKSTNTETVTVNCWYWANPEDDTDMRKVTVQKTFAVNSSIADMFTHIFQDIYAHPDKPVINIVDGGMGTWVLRGKSHNNSNTLSAHSMGTAIDINPSTGSFYINGKWYGNAYNQRAMPTDIWLQLPESHRKYHVLYEDSAIVKIFKDYGWYWGGDWNSTPDPMHLAFLGDGNSARLTGLQNLAGK